jgi:tetratricopeptide (TPR) repeat protein
LVLLVAVAVFDNLSGGETSSARFTDRAATALQEARKKYAANTNDADAAWQIGRACFDRAEFARNDDEREGLANEGIAACRRLITRTPTSAPGHYYLAMNLGQLARTRTLGALRIVDEMEREFQAARALDAKFDHAGPERNLGLLYFEAPGWPASIGNKRKAREHLQRAVEISGDFPENRLCLAEACLKWKDNRGAQKELRALERILPAARTELTGEAWERSWLEWQDRLRALREKLGVYAVTARNEALVRGVDPPEKNEPQPSTDTARVVKVDDQVIGKVVSVNSALRFVVMDFAIRRLPAMEQRLNIYRSGQKIGEVKVTGPTLEMTVAGDIVAGEAQIGDEVRSD